VEEGATIVRVGVDTLRLDRRGKENPLLALKFPPAWASPDSWHRTLVYFGLAEDRDAYEEEEEQPAAIRAPEAELEDRYRERPNVRRLSTRRRRDEIDDIFADDSPRSGAPVCCAGRRAARNGNGGDGPRAPRDPEVLQRRPGRGRQVQGRDPRDHQPAGIRERPLEAPDRLRLGLTYALDGGMQRIADKVFLLTPRNVELSSERRARLIEKGFFNQSRLPGPCN
jgi:cell division inhibitor SepF